MKERLMNKVDSLLLKNMNEGLQEAKKEGFDIGKISDGYHTFDELYEHRISLFMCLCKYIADQHDTVWKSKVHSDGSVYEGWFIMGINTKKGKQISYHLPMDKWGECWMAKELDKAPEWDGHTSADVLERLNNL